MSPIASYMAILHKGIPTSLCPGWPWFLSPLPAALWLQPYWLLPPPPRPCTLPPPHPPSLLLLLLLLLLFEGPHLECASLQPSLCLVNSYLSFISQLKITSSRSSPVLNGLHALGPCSALLGCSSLHFLHWSLRVCISFLLVQTLFHRLWESKHFQARERWD